MYSIQYPRPHTTNRIRAWWGSSGCLKEASDPKGPPMSGTTFMQYLGPDVVTKALQHVDDTSLYIWTKTLRALIRTVVGVATEWEKSIRPLRLVTSTKTTFIPPGKATKAAQAALQKWAQAAPSVDTGWT